MICVGGARISAWISEQRPSRRRKDVWKGILWDLTRSRTRMCLSGSQDFGVLRSALAGKEPFVVASSEMTHTFEVRSGYCGMLESEDFLTLKDAFVRILIVVPPSYTTNRARREMSLRHVPCRPKIHFRDPESPSQDNHDLPLCTGGKIRVMRYCRPVVSSRMDCASRYRELVVSRDLKAQLADDAITLSCCADKDSRVQAVGPYCWMSTKCQSVRQTRANWPRWEIT